MYFIKYQPLKEKLSNRTLSEREALPYLVVFTALTALTVGVPLYENYNTLDAIAAGFSVLIAIFGILFAYKQNGENEGFDLIKKYVVLGWVTTVRFIIVSIPLGIAAAFGAGALGLSMDETNVIDLAFWIGFEAMLYYRIGIHIRDTREAIKTE
jgi:predicted membrane channel-forming protein YqfA (hemolysin III family)